MRGSLALLTAAALMTLSAGCGRGDDERAARRVAESLHAALAAGDGAAACAQLTSAAVQSLERQAGKPCARAVLGLHLTGARARHVQVYETDAAATFAGGRIAYLDLTDTGWRVSAAGCTPQGEAPADCELEG